MNVQIDTDQREALAQAIARWGTRAVVAEERVLVGDGEVMLLRCVGRTHDDHAWWCLGAGPSWASAFTEADKAERRVRR